MCVSAETFAHADCVSSPIMMPALRKRRHSAVEHGELELLAGPEVIERIRDVYTLIHCLSLGSKKGSYLTLTGPFRLSAIGNSKSGIIPNSEYRSSLKKIAPTKK